MSVRWQLDCAVQVGDFRLELALDEEADVLAVFGPSGAGKSLLVEILAGVRPAEGASILLNGEPLHDQPARARGIGWVPQEGALFPHRTVRENLAYGAAADADTDRVIEVCGLADLIDRAPASLSGGERQRAALARALCRKPRLLLLDEPLAAVDLPRRARVFRHLVAVRDAFGIPMLYVSHDPAEVLALADRVVLIEGGRAVSSGDPRELLADAQALRFLDRLGFENVLEVEVGERQEGMSLAVRTQGGAELIAPPARRLPDETAWLAVRGEDVLLAAERPERISARNILEGSVAAIEESGNHLLVRVDAPDPWVARLTRRATAELGLEPGRKAWVVVKTHAFHWLADA